MQKKIYFSILISLFAFYLVGCLTSNSLPEPSDELDNRVPITQTNELDPSATPTGGIITPTSHSTEGSNVSRSERTEKSTVLYSVHDIPAGYIHNLVWTSDSRILSFKIDNEDWVHDLFSQASQSATITQLEDSLTLTPELSVETTDSFSDSLNLVSVSPSSQRAIYFNLVDMMLNQSSPGDTRTDGELPIKPYTVEIWIWAADRVTKVSTIEICGSNIFLWSESERFLTVQTSCLFPEIWLIDFEKEAVFPVLPLGEYGGFVDLYDYTVDQKNLLVSYTGADDDGQFAWLYIVDLETITVTKLETPRFVWPIASFTSEKLVILYSHQFGIDGTKRPALFDLRDNEITDLLDSECDRLLGGLDIQWGELSPDKSHLAFTTIHEPFARSALWLLKIN